MGRKMIQDDDDFSEEAIKRAYRREYYKKNKEKLLENARAYREKNKDESKEKGRAYREKNKDKFKERRANLSEESKERAKASRKRWAEENKERIKETRKKRLLTNPEATARHLEYRKARRTVWRTENPELYKEINKKNAVSLREKRNSDKDTFIEYAFASLKRGAYKRNISWNLEFDQFKSVAESVEYCALSNRPVFFEIGNRDRISVDRIDNTRGYDFDNIQFVSTEVNMIRNSLSMQDFLKMCFDIAETYGYKKKKK